MFNKQSIAAIVPCYNEGPRLSKVITPLIRSKLLDEIIVVDDSSSDNSVAVLLQYDGKIKIIRHKKNLGKTAAVCTGLKQASADCLFFLDADLIGLQPKHIDKSIKYFFEHNLDMLIIPVRSEFLSAYTQLVGWGILATGQRILKRKHAQNLLKHPHIGFGLEMYLNKLATHKKWRIDTLIWKNEAKAPSTPSKIKKFGLFTGLKKELKMLEEVAKETDLQDYISHYRSLVIKKSLHSNNIADKIISYIKSL